jgi:hypothetical protein
MKRISRVTKDFLDDMRVKSLQATPLTCLHKLLKQNENQLSSQSINAMTENRLGFQNSKKKLLSISMSYEKSNVLWQWHSVIIGKSNRGNFLSLFVLPIKIIKF